MATFTTTNKNIETFSVTSKNTATLTGVSKTTTMDNFYLLIDNTFNFLIDNTYKLKIGGGDVSYPAFTPLTKN